MILDMQDSGISQDLFLHGKREIISTNYLIRKKLIKKGDVILEIGANIGYYALLESTLMNGTGKIYAVEPNKKNYRILKKNVEQNMLKNIEPYNFAFGERNGNAKLYLSKGYNTHSMIKGNYHIGAEDVKQMKVDTFLKGRDAPTMIRMDVEGYEYQIIKGMKKTLKTGCNILMEIHPDILSRKQIMEILNLLETNDYKIKTVIVDPREHLISKMGLPINNVFLTTLLTMLGVEKELKFGNYDVSLSALPDFIDQFPWIAPHILFVKN